MLRTVVSAAGRACKGLGRSPNVTECGAFQLSDLRGGMSQQARGMAGPAPSRDLTFGSTKIPFGSRLLLVFSGAQTPLSTHARNFGCPSMERIEYT